MEQYMYDVLYQIEETHWWYVGRRSLILDQIARFCQEQKELRLLDIGCGAGIFMKYLEQYGEVIGLDSSSDALHFCRQRNFSQLVRGEGLSLPFSENTFDILTANDLLEHLEDDTASLREFLRVLKSGGRLFLFVPAYQFLWSLQDEISHHKRRYTTRQLSRIIDAAGFKLESITYANTLLFPIIFAGRQVLKVLKHFKDIRTENDLHPGWANKLLANIFCLEVPILRRMRLPFGVSIIAVCQKP
jgi:ubiquinone/menaquinone biosynthesis C-methylase UbiE